MIFLSILAYVFIAFACMYLVGKYGRLRRNEDVGELVMFCWLWPMFLVLIPVFILVLIPFALGCWIVEWGQDVGGKS